VEDALTTFATKDALPAVMAKQQPSANIAGKQKRCGGKESSKVI